MTRKGKEFPNSVIEHAYRKSGGKCEHCGGDEKIEVHHILPLWFAAEYFPQLASWVLKSAENAQCLCAKCHDKVHRENNFKAFESHALLLITIMGELLL